LCDVQKLLPFNRRARSAIRPLEQHGIQAMLQIALAAAERRLPNLEPLGRSTETPVLRGDDRLTHFSEFPSHGMKSRRQPVWPTVTYNNLSRPIRTFAPARQPPGRLKPYYYDT